MANKVDNNLIDLIKSFRERKL